MINYEEGWIIKLLFRVQGSVIPKACSFALPATLVTLLLLYIDEYQPTLREDIDVLDLSGSTIWNAVTAGLLLLIGFRTNRAIDRFWEGAGLLHQMRGEWFDTVSNCVTFSSKALSHSPEKVLRFRHALVRLMSLCHGSALEEISDNLTEQEVIDYQGLDKQCLQQLKTCNDVYNFNKVEVTLHMIQSLIISAYNEGILDVPAPILSRVYQTISRGFVNLLNTKKITDVKFPFPYAQLIALLLFAFTIVSPVVISSFVENHALACVFTFTPVFAVAALNYIAIELENPFGRDSNDLPLSRFQEEMNCCLMMLLDPKADLVTTTSPDCVMDFETLCSIMHPPEKRIAGNRKRGFERHNSYILALISSRSSSLSENDRKGSKNTFRPIFDRRRPSVDSRRSSSDSWKSPAGPTDKEAEEEDDEQPPDAPREPQKDQIMYVEPFKGGTLESIQARSQLSPPSPPSGGSSDSAVYAPPGGNGHGAAQPLSPRLPVTEGLETICTALDSWTELLETQVQELHNSFSTLHELARGHAQAAPNEQQFVGSLGCHRKYNVRARRHVQPGSTPPRADKTGLVR